jgi:hypothetical protein
MRDQIAPQNSDRNATSPAMDDRHESNLTRQNFDYGNSN